MANEQGRTLTTVGELKQELNSLPDTAKLSFSSGAGTVIDPNAGIMLEQTEGNVTFRQPPSGGARQQG